MGKDACVLDEYKYCIDGIVNGEAVCALPIVLISKKEDGELPVDVSDLAFKLQG